MMKMYFGVGTHKILFLDNAFAEFVSRKFSSKSCLFTKKKKIKVENKTVKIRFNRCFLNFCQILKMFPCFHLTGVQSSVFWNESKIILCVRIFAVFCFNFIDWSGIFWVDFRKFGWIREQVVFVFQFHQKH